MPRQVFPLNLVDFTGGLNLRADAFQLLPNESPDMLNVEVDPRGGFRSRNGWESWNVSPVYDGFYTDTFSRADVANVEFEFESLWSCSGGQWGIVSGGLQVTSVSSRSTAVVDTLNVSHEVTFSFDFQPGALSGAVGFWVEVARVDNDNHVRVNRAESGWNVYRRASGVDTFLAATGAVENESGEMSVKYDARSGYVTVKVDGVVVADVGAGVSFPGTKVAFSDKSVGGVSISQVRVGLIGDGSTVPSSFRTSATWVPQKLSVWKRFDGNRLLLCNNNLLWTGVESGGTGVFTPLRDQYGAQFETLPAHGVDTAQWLDNLFVARGELPVLQLSPSGVTELEQSGPVWQNDYLAPVDGFFPAAHLVATHLGCVFAADTVEEGVRYACRLRWSHPNSPTNWASDDYIDIVSGGSRIVGVAPFGDHLVVVKDDSVWALFGYDAESWQLMPVTEAVGGLGAGAVAESPGGLFFVSTTGVFRYSQDGIQEISEQLRPLWDERRLDLSEPDRFFLGWLNNRLWFTGPHVEGGGVYVWDGSIGQRGAWVRHACPCGAGLGPMAALQEGDDRSRWLACHSADSFVMQVDLPGVVDDKIGESLIPFTSYYSTRWLHGDWPTLRKSWRRPDIVVSGSSQRQVLRVDVYRDYDDVSLRRQFVIETGADSAIDWGPPATWGVGNWSSVQLGSFIEHGKFLGTARAIRVVFRPEVGANWGIDAVVFKFIPRRFR